MVKLEISLARLGHSRTQDTRGVRGERAVTVSPGWPPQPSCLRSAITAGAAG